jgi:glycosyltransferase involved in cell wall biosynthesis
MDVKVILIYRQDPLPYHGIGSRTELYRRYFESECHHIDHIICPKPKIKEFKGVKYHYLKNKTSFGQRLFSKLSGRNQVIDSLISIVRPDTNYIIKIIDDTGIIQSVNELFRNATLKRSQFKIAFFYHGFDLELNRQKEVHFMESVSHIIYLTHLSYRYNKDKFTVFPPLATVMHNGIDLNKFKSGDLHEILNLKERLGINPDDHVFMWCSQDRPKKGIDLTLILWKRLVSKYSNAKLIVVGIDRNIDMEGVINIGKVSNDNLPQYYQMSDVYLFTTLCKEGFGLTLIEALKCGCYCIASDYGGVAEVLDYGNYGRLIKNPHFVDEWIDAIDEYFEKPNQLEPVPLKKYSSSAWNNQMNQLLLEIKQEF